MRPPAYSGILTTPLAEDFKSEASDRLMQMHYLHGAKEVLRLTAKWAIESDSQVDNAKTSRKVRELFVLLRWRQKYLPVSSASTLFIISELSDDDL